MGSYSLYPITAHTWPGPRKPCTRLSGDCRMASRAGGTSTGDLHAIERRVNNTHVAAHRFDSKQVPVGARNAQHVAEGAEDHVRLPRYGVRIVVYFQRPHQYRTSAPV